MWFRTSHKIVFALRKVGFANYIAISGYNSNYYYYLHITHLSPQTVLYS